MNEWNQLLFDVNGMTVYRSLLRDEGIAALAALIEGEGEAPQAAYAAAGHYARLCCVLQHSGMSLCDYIYAAALYNDNLFTRMAADGEHIPADLSAAAKHDLRALSALAYLTPEKLKALLCRRLPELQGQIQSLPDFKTGHSRYFADERDWGNELQAFWEFCRENGSGSRARYQAATADEETMRRLFVQCEPWVQEYLSAKLQQLWTGKSA